MTGPVERPPSAGRRDVYGGQAIPEPALGLDVRAGFANDAERHNAPRQTCG